jgi:hypothetical protein
MSVQIAAFIVLNALAASHEVNVGGTGKNAANGYTGHWPAKDCELALSFQ